MHGRLLKSNMTSDTINIKTKSDNEKDLLENHDQITNNLSTSITTANQLSK